MSSVSRSVVKLANDPQCYRSDSKTLVIVLGAGATLLANEKLELLAHNSGLSLIHSTNKGWLTFDFISLI